MIAYKGAQWEPLVAEKAVSCFASEAARTAAKCLTPECVALHRLRLSRLFKNSPSECDERLDDPSSSQNSLSMNALCAIVTLKVI